MSKPKGDRVALHDASSEIGDRITPERAFARRSATARYIIYAGDEAAQSFRKRNIDDRSPFIATIADVELPGITGMRGHFPEFPVAERVTNMLPCQAAT